MFLFIRRLYVRNFWSHEKRLPTATLERMLTVLNSLYSGQIERCFLSLATNLLLEMTSQSPDFKRDMFEYPLSECTFQVSSVHITCKGSRAVLVRHWPFFTFFNFIFFLLFSFGSPGLRHWFQLALPEHGDDADVCGDSEHSRPREFSCDPVRTGEGDDPGHPGVLGVFSDPSRRCRSSRNCFSGRIKKQKGWC